MKRAMFLALALSGSVLFGSDHIPADMMAKIMVTLNRMSGSPERFVCDNHKVGAFLRKLGATVDPEAAVALAETEAEVRALHARKKLVICSDMSLLPKGAAIAVVEEDGRYAIYLHLHHIDESGVKFTPELLKLSYVINTPAVQ